MAKKGLDKKVDDNGFDIAKHPELEKIHQKIMGAQEAKETKGEQKKDSKDEDTKVVPEPSFIDYNDIAEIKDLLHELINVFKQAAEEIKGDDFTQIKNNVEQLARKNEMMNNTLTALSKKIGLGNVDVKDLNQHAAEIKPATPPPVAPEPPKPAAPPPAPEPPKPVAPPVAPEPPKPAAPPPAPEPEFPAETTPIQAPAPQPDMSQMPQIPQAPPEMQNAPPLPGNMGEPAPMPPQNQGEQPPLPANQPPQNIPAQQDEVPMPPPAAQPPGGKKKGFLGMFK